MDAAVVGILTAISAVAGLLYWLLLARPELTLSLFHDTPINAERGEHQWFETHPGALRLLRWSLGVAIVLCAFLTGLALSFLSSTR